MRILTKENLGKEWTYTALGRRVLCIAVKGDMNDWAAYIGAVKGEDHVKEAQVVADVGTKIPYWMAQKLFPSMDSMYVWRD